jgi:peptide/nickel transport system substrate-binding protein
MSPRDDSVDHLVTEFVQQQIDRREFFRRSAALGLTLGAASALLAACGGGGGGGTEATSTGATGAAGETATAGAAVAEGGTLKIRLLNDIINLDPPFIPASADEITGYGVFEGLVTYKPGTWEVVNQLAETFEPSPDGLQFKFKLKEGIPFHGDYGELTTEDVKFSYERTAGLTKPAIDSPYKGDWAALKEVKVTSPYEGTIILKEPFAPMMTTTLPIFSGWVVSKKAVEDRGKKFATNPIGTGPYEFVEWKPKQQASVKRFAKYGGASADLLGTYWDEIVFIPIEEDEAAGIALETGDIDFGELPLTSVSRFQDSSDFTVEKRTSLDYNWIGMNIENPKLKDINVRQAIRYAIDVPAILEASFEGLYARASAILPQGMPIGYWADAPVYERDVDKAKSYLSQASSPPTELEVKFTEEVGAKELAEIVQANLGELGINVKLTQLDSSAYYALEKDELRSRELFYVGFITNPDPYWSMEWFTCDQIDVWNWMYWCSDEFDRLQKDAVKELDQDKRSQMYIQMQQLWDQAVDTVWVAWPTRYFGSRSGIQPSLRDDGRILPIAFAAQA